MEHLNHRNSTPQMRNPDEEPLGHFFIKITTKTGFTVIKSCLIKNGIFSLSPKNKHFIFSCDYPFKLGVLAHSCNLAPERLGLLGCVRLVGHILLSEGRTSVRIIKLKNDVARPGAG